ncbi:Hypothetical protein ERS075547_02622 [Mycobacteroides abscessus]|nr:Hypothetical protein ERS075547_02622 [Mycobacteroides abscessus]
MSDEQELQRELDLIRSVADRSVMDIEAAGREAIAEIDRRATAPWTTCRARSRSMS